MVESGIAPDPGDYVAPSMSSFLDEDPVSQSAEKEVLPITIPLPPNVHVRQSAEEALPITIQPPPNVHVRQSAEEVLPITIQPPSNVHIGDGEELKSPQLTGRHRTHKPSLEVVISDVLLDLPDVQLLEFSREWQVEEEPEQESQRTNSISDPEVVISEVRLYPLNVQLLEISREWQVEEPEEESQRTNSNSDLACPKLKPRHEVLLVRTTSYLQDFNIDKSLEMVSGCINSPCGPVSVTALLGPQLHQNLNPLTRLPT
jgi:hypothetical protein